MMIIKYYNIGHEIKYIYYTYIKNTRTQTHRHTNTTYILVPILRLNAVY